MTWYVITERADPEPDARVWTVSEDPERAGWENDDGCEGYGLTQEKAQFLADAANSVDYRLENHALRKALWAIVRRAGGKLELSMNDLFDSPQNAKFIFSPPALDRPLIMTIEMVNEP